MDAKKLLRDYLSEFFTVQLATVDGDQPWVCTVRFIADEQNNLFWASLPTRRHSQEIAKHSKVAAAIVVHNVIGEPVIGIQLEGTAEMQKPSVKHKAIADQYATKFKRDQQWVDDFIS